MEQGLLQNWDHGNVGCDVPGENGVAQPVVRAAGIGLERLMAASWEHHMMDHLGLSVAFPMHLVAQQARNT